MAVQCRRRWMCSLALVPKDASHQVLDLALNKGNALLPKDASEQVLDIALHKGKALKKIVSAELVLDFGYHKGKSLAAAPSGYLGWIVQHFRDKDGVKQQWALHAQKVLDARNARRLAEDQLRRQIVRTLDVSIRQASVAEVLTQLESQADCVDPSLVQGALLKRCIDSRSLAEGKLVHEHILQSGAGKNRYLGNLLILMYGKCGRLDKAWEVFKSIQNRNDRSYGIMMSVLQNERPLQALELWQRMEEDGVQADAFIVTSALAACTKLRALEEGKAIHEHLVLSQFKTDEVLDTALLRFYSKCGSIEDAKLVFEGMKTKDLFGWSAIISALNQKGQCEEALVFYRKMVSEGMQPNGVVYASALSACAKLGALEVGRGIHNRVVETGAEQDEILQDALLNMYAKCSVLREAEAVFQAMEEKSRRIESWTSMMSAYVQAGRFSDALKLYDRLLLASGQEPNEYTLTTVLAACAGLRDLKRGKEVHARVVSAGLEGNVAIQTALVSMYSKCRCPEEAQKVLENMEAKKSEAMSEARNLITSTYAEQGHHLAALEMYKRTEPSDQTATVLMSAVEACAALGALQEGRELQQRLTELGDDLLLAAGPRLIDMYHRCGSLEDAEQVFNRLEGSEDCANAMLAAYASASTGTNKAVLEFRQQMFQDGVRLDPSSSLLAVLWSLRGEDDGTEAVEQARKDFQAALTDEALVPLLEHYLCVVELLGRAGKLSEAEEVLESMPYEAPSTGWLVLLRACKRNRDLIRGERIAAKLFDTAADDAEPYVLLSSMYSEAGRGEDAARMRRRMVSRGFGTPDSGGHSLIETNSGELHKFESNDEMHPRIEEVRALLLGLGDPLKEAGYVPCAREVLADEDGDGEEAKERQLCFHSERLAIGFGLLTAEDEEREPIRVIKTVGKMCSDCHSAVKVMSDVVERRIMVRDGSGFHWFHQGVCSCGDCW